MLDQWVVYDQNHHFDLVRIPKSKPILANSLDGYRNRYQNHISKEESSNQYIVWDFSLKGTPKTKFAAKY